VTLANVLGQSTIAYGTSTAKHMDTDNLLKDNLASHQGHLSSGGSPFDLGIHKDERLIEMLRREGKIAVADKFQL
jgi:hypothetical protein